ncbi:hypothetical protein F5144DRAFT_173104 [Chaetomium tenue]|uniref:Uncharacterized protein n=1 Tax=Chaetomium tenue TaxID=1854479 RepID=A0ACB7PD76_9PEZI|nr:hypothetical protein F5144DRAFT_173104 [Chaetomium globosum]
MRTINMSGQMDGLHDPGPRSVPLFLVLVLTPWGREARATGIWKGTVPRVGLRSKGRRGFRAQRSKSMEMFRPFLSATPGHNSKTIPPGADSPRAFLGQSRSSSLNPLHI